MLRRVLVVLAGVLVVGALGAGSAFAVLSYPPDGVLSPASGAFGSELGANSVAVDEANGDTYVADRRAGVVDVFDTATGASLGGLDSSLTPSGSFGGGPPLAVAVNSATGAVYVSDAADNVVDVFDGAGGYVCQIMGSSAPSASECNGVAGSDTPEHGLHSPRGVAVDQATGEVFVVDEEDSVVDVFSAAGAYLRQVASAAVPGGFGRLRGLAVSGFNGHLYVTDVGNGVVDEFDAAGVWVTTWTGANTPAGSFGGEESQSSVAVDDGSGRVYVSDAADGVIDVFEASGEYLTQLRGFAFPSGVAVGQASHRVYVSDDNSQSATGSVEIFGPGVVVPNVITGSASQVRPARATVGGGVNPEGIALTGCRFEYGIDTYYGQSAPCVPAAGAIPVDSNEHAVSADIAGLAPGVTYHFRLEAANANGVNFGEDATFQTPPAPSIDDAAAVNVTGTSADLTARINPNGFDTTYRFEWGTSTEYGASVPVPDGDIGAGTSDVPVVAHLSGLSANTTYHWRIVAASENGSPVAGDHTFVYDTMGGSLPDNRAYEMVTPPQKNAALVGNMAVGVSPSVSEDGSRLIVTSLQCFADAGSCTASRGSEGEPFAFTRADGGWVTTAMAPSAMAATGNSEVMANADAGSALFSIATRPFGEDDFYVRQPDGSFVDIGPVSPPSAGAKGATPVYGTVGTADFSHVVYDAYAGHEGFWPFDATVGTTSFSAYEYVGAGNAHPVLVGVSGGPGSTDLISACSTIIGKGTLGYNALSADGGTVFFQASKCASGSGVNAGVPVPSVELFARVGGARTVLVSGRSPLDCVSAGCVGSPPGDTQFEGASGDGSRVFFTDTQQLTDSASEDSDGSDGAEEPGCSLSTGVNGCNLYEYDFSRPAGHGLVAVSAGDSSGGGPRVQGVMAISEDGSHVYFVARGVLTGVANDRGQVARDGAENLYVFERDASHPEGRLAFIAGLSGENVSVTGAGLDSDQWLRGITRANVTPDGRFLVFLSHERLTADDTSATGAAQVFRYDAQTGVLARISVGEHGFNDNGNAGTRNATIVPVARGFASGNPVRPDPTMSHDGAFVFFQSPVALTPGAVDDVRIGTNPVEGAPIYAGNVYEWHEGHVYLISDGRDTSQFFAGFFGEESGGGGPTAVNLVGSDASGANVFFTTADRLVGQDTDSGVDYYDARVCISGDPCIAAPSGSSGACQGEACHGTPGVAPVFGAPGSAVFSGAGNAAPLPAPVVKVKKKAKPTRRAHGKKKAKHRKKRKGHKAVRTDKHIKRRRK
jgi:DNA-binding beta-propeller fold protein YncE